MLNVATRMGYLIPTMSTDGSPLREALKTAASALLAEGVPFALAGSYALWVHGGPEPTHDVDLVVPESDVEQAAKILGGVGFDVGRPPENWLFKAWWDGCLVDVLHRVNGVMVERDLIDDATVHDVLAVPMPVLSATVVLVQKLKSLNEHHCDFASLLPGVRAVREQVDWTHVRIATADNDFAAAFLFLTDRLGITVDD